VTGEIAFVGDVHGSLVPLRRLWRALGERGVHHVVFLGDYVNKGGQSAEVFGQLLSYSRAGQATLLRGNHEMALLEALDTGDVRAFLKMGGAMTIRSYVGGEVGADVFADFRREFPTDHLNAIREMPETFELVDLIAQHTPPAEPTTKFLVTAHVPAGRLPRINGHSARIDTGCGSPSGRLTALLWPSLHYIQADG
jgi:serine/threonine protein phosphatase 1